VTVPGELDAVMLEGYFGAPRSGLMAAQVENGGQPPDEPSGNVEVSRHIEARQAFEDNILHAISVAFELAGGARAERRPLRHRIETQHVKQLLSDFQAAWLPFGERLDVGQIAAGDPGRRRPQLLLNYPREP